jgi:hypothetical protein
MPYLALIILMFAAEAFAGRPSVPYYCGRVCDAVTGQPLPGVRVLCREIGAAPQGRASSGSSDVVYTDFEGRYRILPYYTMVTFSRPGYLTHLTQWSNLNPSRDESDLTCSRVQDAGLKRTPQ